MKTFQQHKSAGKKTLTNPEQKSNGGNGGGGGGHFNNAKLNRHSQNHRLKGKSLKPQQSTSVHKRDGSANSFGGATATEDSNGGAEKEKDDLRNEYIQFLEVLKGRVVPVISFAVSLR